MYAGERVPFSICPACNERAKCKNRPLSMEKHNNKDAAVFIGAKRLLEIQKMILTINQCGEFSRNSGFNISIPSLTLLKIFEIELREADLGFSPMVPLALKRLPTGDFIPIMSTPLERLYFSQMNVVSKQEWKSVGAACKAKDGPRT